MEEIKITVITHPRERAKKCSMRGLRGRKNFEFFKAVDGFSFDATGFTSLELGAPEISPSDASRPLLILDGTWRLLPKIKGKIFGNPVPRGLPNSLKTAYPRTSKLFKDPEGGLASAEALFAALFFMGIPDFSVLEKYPFGEEFLRLNEKIFGSFGNIASSGKKSEA